MGRMASLAATLAAVLPFVLAGPCSTYDAPISWGSCSSLGYAPPLECAFVKVPLDYHDCSAGTATLAVGRVNATASPKLGSIFINPGGPGSSGLQYLNSTAANVLATTGGHHDLITWDPRGVGNTIPLVNCKSSAIDGALYANNSIIIDGPQYSGNFTNGHWNDPKVKAFLKQAPVTDGQLEDIVQACVAANGVNLKYVGSAAAVRDMVRLSDIIEGEGKPVNYWGISYGSIIGEYFANMFPHRVGKVVIDGVLNPLYWTDYQRYKLLGYTFEWADAVYTKFLSSCIAAGPALCPIASTNSTIASLDALFQSILAQAVKTWTPTNPAAVRSSDLRSEFFGQLTQPLAWPGLAQMVFSLANGTSSPSKKRDVVPMSQYEYATQAITCSDAADNHGVTTEVVFDAIVEASIQTSRMFGTNWDPGYWCHKWPVRAVERYAGPWNAKTRQPILVVTNTYDPITPKKGAEAVAGWLGKSAVVLVRDGYGHTSISSLSPCFDAAMAKFFVNSKYPKSGTVCPTNENYFAPPPNSTSTGP